MYNDIAIAGLVGQVGVYNRQFLLVHGCEWMKSVDFRLNNFHRHELGPPIGSGKCSRDTM